MRSGSGVRLRLAPPARAALRRLLGAMALPTQPVPQALCFCYSLYGVAFFVFLCAELAGSPLFTIDADDAPGAHPQRPGRTLRSGSSPTRFAAQAGCS